MWLGIAMSLPRQSGARRCFKLQAAISLEGVRGASLGRKAPIPVGNQPAIRVSRCFRQREPPVFPKTVSTNQRSSGLFVATGPEGR